MRFILAAAPLALAGVRAAGPTHGVVVGDVTSSRATVWSRSDEASTMQVSVYECGARVEGEEVTGEVTVNSTNDFTGLVDLAGLTDDTCYEVEVVFNPPPASSATSTPASSTASASGESAFATFRTAPRPSVATAVRFAWGGDISGQNVCRDADEGFPLMDVINGAGPYDFFLNVGDAIYGDGECTSPGLGGNVQVVGDFERSADLDNFWAHWKYNLEDPGYQTLLSSQAFFMTWDDHEVVDDFGPGFDERSTPPYNAGESLLPIGLQAFLNYNPIRATTDPTKPLDFYRTVRWGQSVELFILDTRQYRSLPTDEDTAANPKTMLGETQLAWLKSSLTDSTALWKMVVTSIPLSVPTGPGDDERDGWANFEGNTGYEIELEDILTHMKDGEMNNVVFITADVHFAQVLEYTPFAGDRDFGFHEIIVGPLNAGPFKETDLDDTFSPKRRFYYGPESNSLSGDMSYAEFRPFFNFGLAEIDLDGNLTISIINTDAETVYSTTLAARVDSEVPTGTVTPSPASAISGSSAGSATIAPPTLATSAPPASATSAPAGAISAPIGVTPAPTLVASAPTHATTAPTLVTTAPTHAATATATDEPTSSPASTPAPSAAATGTVNGTAAPLATPSPSVAPDGEEPGTDGSGTDGSGVGAGARPPQGFHRFFCGFSLVGVVGLSRLIGGRW